MKKIKLLLATLAVFCGVGSANAQASYNQTYTVGAEIATGYDYFLYNIGSGTFLTGGMDWGSKATGDHAGKTVEFRSVSEGVYKIWSYYYSPNGLSNDGWLGTNEYFDAGEGDLANCVFTPVSVGGYTNAYTIKDNVNNKYLYYNTADTRVNWGDNTNDNYSYWLIIPKASRNAVGDYTYYIQNAGINRFWERACWAGLNWKNEGVFTTGGKAANPCGEKYHATLDFYQTISKDDLPAGRYRLYVQAFWRQDGTAAGPVLYLDDQTQTLSLLNGNGEGTAESMDGASDAFTAGKYVNSVEKFFSSAPAANSIRLGINITDGSQWVIWDNFYLKYLGQCVMDYAIALPVDGAMTADTWYYKDIALAADNYKATATTLGDIICTDDGYSLISASGNVALNATDNSLAAKRYYFKSSSANNLKIQAASYSYSVSDATTDITYIQKGKTVTVNFVVSSNEPDVELSQDYSGVTFAGEAISVTPTASGFTFTVPEVTVNNTYTLAIPAEAIGYASGYTYNSAQEITLKTPAIFDGIYYFYNTYTESYLSRGNTWGTQAIVDKYGLPAYLSFDGDGKTKVQFFDNQKYLSEGGWLYADNGSGGQFFVEAVVGGYKLKDATTEKYVAVNGGNIVGDAVEGVNLYGTSNVWALETLAAYKAKDLPTQYANAQAADAVSNVTLLDELGTITTKTALETELASNYTATPITITGSKAQKYQENAWGGDGGVLNENEYYKETVEGLTPGLYRLRVDAFQRAATNGRVALAEGARSLIYLYAGSAKTQLKSVMEYAATEAYTSGEDPDYAWKGKHYPNNENSGYDALATGNYTNDVFVYVADEGEGTGSLTFGINNPQNAAANQIWCVYDNWTLTLYEKKPFTASFVNGEGWEHVYAYVWNPGSPNVIINGDWPGTELKTKSGTATYNGEELDVYTYSVVRNGQPGMIIFNNGESGVNEKKTADLTFVDGMLDDSKVTKVPVYAVVGSKSGDDNDKAIFSAAWDQATTTDILTESAGTYSKTYTNQTLDKQTVKFKVIKKDYKEATTAKAWYPASDQTFSIPVKGIYNITITFNGNEGSPVVASVATKTAEAVTIGETGETDWATTVTNSALDFSGVTEFTAYTATVDGSTVTLNEVDDVQAETGLVLRGTAGTYYVPVTESSSTDKGSLSGNSLEGFTIHSNYADFYYGLKVTDGMAKFAQIQKPTGDDTFTIPAGKAFLIIHGDYARELSVVFAGETTTGIANMKAAKEDGLYYNLNGQRVNAPAKGLYIVNGKKVVKK